MQLLGEYPACRPLWAPDEPIYEMRKLRPWKWSHRARGLSGGVSAHRVVGGGMTASSLVFSIRSRDLKGVRCLTLQSKGTAWDPTSGAWAWQGAPVSLSPCAEISSSERAALRKQAWKVPLCWPLQTHP